MRPVYVYALVDKPSAQPLRGKRRIEFLPVAGIYAAVERRVSPPEVTEAALREQHKIVVELAHRCDPILPVRFGGWLSPDELQTLVASRARFLQDAFELVRHREQMTVRMFGELAPVQQKSPRSQTGGKAYLEHLRNAARPRLTPAADAVRAAVRPIAAAERLEGGSGRVQVAIHHLIERGQSDAYGRLVRRAVASVTTTEEVVVSGPWPPFAFTPDLWP